MNRTLRVGLVPLCAVAFGLPTANAQSTGSAKGPTKTKVAKAKVTTSKVTTSKVTTSKVTAKVNKRRPVSVRVPKVTTTSTLLPTTTVTAPVIETTTAAPVVSVLTPTTSVTPPSIISVNTIALPSVTSPASTTTTKAPATTTTLVPAPFPAPANNPTRLTAASIEPYRGMGTWVDHLDYTVRYSGKPVPPFTVASVDAMAAQGVQTLFIQGSKWNDPADVLEPERLLPIIDRAHQLGVFVVVWYLPEFQDVNTDLRKIVALANLDVDGISIDIEGKTGVPKDVAERTRRLISLSQSLRSLLPGRFISNNIVVPTLLDGVPGLWTLPDGRPPQAGTLWWGGAFPYVEIASAYDLWMIQAYWTNRSYNSGWRDGYRYGRENVLRLRATLNRPDLPVSLIGGVGPDKPALNDLSGMMQAARETGTYGFSFYDYVTTDPSFWQYMRGFRTPGPDGQPDPRFPAVSPPPYVPSLPPPVTTTMAPPPTFAPPPGTIPPVVVSS